MIQSMGFTLVELLIVIAILGIVAGGITAAINPLAKINSANLAKAETFDASIQNNLSFDLIGEWKFDGNANDTSGYGTVTNVNGANLTNDRRGQSNKAYLFDGISNIIYTANSSVFDTGSMTVSFWFTLITDPDCDASNNWRSLIRKGSAAWSTIGWNVVLEQDKSVQFDIGLNGVTSRSGGINVGITVGIPILLTFTYDASNGNQKIYANGTLKATKVNSPPYNIGSNGLPLALAGGTNAVSCPNGSGYTNGVYDEVRLYSQALSLSQIQQLYAQGLIRHQLARR